MPICRAHPTTAIVIHDTVNPSLNSASAARFKQLREAGERGEHCNVVALLLGEEHRCVDYTQECLSATFWHADSDTSARQHRPRIFAALSARTGSRSAEASIRDCSLRLDAAE